MKRYAGELTFTVPGTVSNLRAMIRQAIAAGVPYEFLTPVDLGPRTGVYGHLMYIRAQDIGVLVTIARSLGVTPREAASQLSLFTSYKAFCRANKQSPLLKSLASRVTLA